MKNTINIDRTKGAKTFSCCYGVELMVDNISNDVSEIYKIYAKINDIFECKGTVQYHNNTICASYVSPATTQVKNLYPFDTKISDEEFEGSMTCSLHWIAINVRHEFGKSCHNI